MEVKVGENFRVGRKIGAGSFGEIYLGINIQTEEEVAIKLEPIKTKFPQLMWESKIIQYLQGGVGIPRLHWFGKDGDFQVMIIELLGHSLEDLFEMCQRKLSIKTVLMLAEQIISRIEYVHAKNFVYRDIKPDNFLIGTGKKADHIYLIDYGLSKRFRDPKTGQHIEYRDGKAFVGTFRYASINSHNGIESSRRDDMEAIGYMLMYFLRGSLPWQGIKANSKQEKYDLIAQAKQNTPVEELCKGFPDEFAGYITYTRNLKFEEKPDYNWLKAQFRNLLYRMDYTIDFIFDWSKMNSNNMAKLKDSGIIEKTQEDSHEPMKKESPFKTMPDSTFSRKHSVPSLKGEKTPQKLGNSAAKSPTKGMKPNGSLTKNVVGTKPAVGISQFNSAGKKDPLVNKQQLAKEKPSITTGGGNFIKAIKSIRKESDELYKNGPLHRSSPNTPSKNKVYLKIPWSS